MKKRLSYILACTLVASSLSSFVACAQPQPCVVNFDDDGIITTVSTKTGSRITLPTDPIDYEDEAYYYEFENWVDKDGNEWKETSTVKGDTTLYANFTKTPKVTFSQAPSFTFAMISDIHQQVGDLSSEGNFKRAIEQLSAQAQLDAVVISGDLCDMAWTETTAKFEDGSQVFYKSMGEKRNQIKNLGRIFETYVPQDTDILFCLGNHDQGAFTGDMGVKINYTKAYNTILSDYYKEKYPTSSQNRYYNNDVTTSYSDSIADYQGMLANGVRYAKMGTNHFLLLDANKFWEINSAYTTVQLDWISDTLAYIDETYPDEPIFVVAHDPVLDSVFGSVDTWGNNCLNDILKNYPQVTMFTGHIHESNYHETAIYQDKGFTVVEASSVKYNSTTKLNATGYDANYTVTTSPYSQNRSSQGLLVRVYPDTTIRITRMDFANEKQAGADWVLDPVTSENRNESYKLANRKAVNQAPYFREGSQIKGVYSSQYLNISFTKARDVDNKVSGYKVVATRGEQTETKYVEGDLAIKDNVSNFSVAFDNPYTISKVEITPIDMLGKEGNSISATSDTFTFYAEKQTKAFDGKSNRFGDVTVNGATYYANTEFYYNDNDVYTNYGSTRTKDLSFVNAYSDKYEFSVNISKARLCRTQTAKINANMIGSCEAFMLGVNLATIEDNDRIYSICAFLDFNRYYETEPSGGWDDVSLRRKNTGYITYRVMATNKGAVHYTYWWDIGTSHAFTNASDLYSAIRSENGLDVKVVRDGADFNIYLNGTFFDSKNLGATFYKNGYMFTFGQNTKSTFGIATYGAEAEFKNLTYTAKV